jgi:hypothetical protein
MTMFNEPEVEAEFEEIKETKFQWVVPFLLGLVAALVLSALVAAAYVMKLGPFASHDRQDKIEASIIDATGEVDQQMADAAMEQAAAAIGLNANGPQPFSIGQLQFGGSALQALNELAGAEASNAIKCQPTLSSMEGGARSAVQLVKCDIASDGGASSGTPPSGEPTAAAPSAGAPQTPATPTIPAKLPASIILSFANGSVTSIVYTSAGIQAPTVPLDPAAPNAANGGELLPGFSLPPSAPQPTNDSAASAGTPPAQ